MATTSILASGIPSSRGRFTLGRAWALVCAMHEARQTRRLLLDMDARALADVGLSRSDAYNEAARPFWDVKGM